MLRHSSGTRYGDCTNLAISRDKTIFTQLQRAIEEKLVNAEGKPYAVFDFDNTCIVNDIAEATLAHLCGHELLRDNTLLGAADDSSEYHARVFRTYYELLEKKKHKAAYMLCARMFSGYTPGEAEATTLAAITEEGVRIGSKVLYDIHIERGLGARREILEVINYLRSKGVSIWIVSASAEPAVRAAARHFGIDANVIGVRSALEDRIFTSKLLEPLPMFEGKVECIRSYINSTHAPILAAGDSMNDLAMLEAAKIRVVVDKKNDLTHIARESGWFIV